MKLTHLLLATSLAASSTLAHAFHCPKDMKQIDAALAKNPKLSEADLAQVRKYRAEGEALHQTGKHQESVDALGKAMKLLKI